MQRKCRRRTLVETRQAHRTRSKRGEKLCPLGTIRSQGHALIRSIKGVKNAVRHCDNLHGWQIMNCWRAAVGIDASFA